MDAISSHENICIKQEEIKEENIDLLQRKNLWTKLFQKEVENQDVDGIIT
jgi:hypothetical protein